MSKKIKIWVLAGFVIFVLFFVKQFFDQKFDSVESLQNYMKGFGIAAPLMLTLFQAVQVVIPVLPGYLGCVAGAIAFGSMTGFWCNYIGISLGSVIAYFLAKKYGIDIVTAMFPDDFLCYFSGLMKMNSKKFIWIIILGKPWCILAYSIVFGLIK